MGSTRQDYHASSLIPLPSKNNKYYVYVTRPKALQGMGKQVKRSTGTSDWAIARSRQHALTEEIYAEFDEQLAQQLAQSNSFEAQIEPLLQQLGKSLYMDWTGETPDNKVPDQSDLVTLVSAYGLSVSPELLASMEPEYLSDIVGMGTPRVTSPRLAESVQLARQSNAEDKLSDLLPKYLEAKHWNRISSENQAKRYISLFIEQIGDRRVKELTLHDAYKFAQYLHDEGRSNSLIKGAISYMRGLLSWAVQQGLLVRSPWADQINLRDYGVAGVRYKPLTKDQLHKLFALEMKDQDRLILSMLITTGMRLDEAALLTWESVKLNDEVPHFDLVGAKVKNRGAERRVAIPDVLLEKLPAPSSGRLFTYPLDKDGKASRKASEKLGAYIRKIRLNDKQVVHSLRGTLKDLLRDAGVSKETNDFITGHDQGDSAGNYGRGPSLEVRRKAINSVEHPWLL